MADREFRAKFTSDESDLTRGAKKVDNSLDSIDRGMGKLAKAGAVAGAGLAVAGVALWDMAEGAAEDEKAAAALAKTLGNVAGATGDQVDAVEEWISAQGRALGVADDDLRPALDALARGTKDVGKAQELASIAMDISAGTGKDLTAVSEALSKAYNGQLGPLRKLDPALADLVKSGASTDEVFQALSKTFEGQAAAAADTTAGKMQIAKLQFAELQEEIGAKVLPVLLKLADFTLTTLIPAIESLVAWIETNWPRFAAAVETGIARIQEAWNTYGQPVLDAIVGAVQTFVDVAMALWATFGDSILAHVQKTWDSIKLRIEGVLDVIRGIWETFAGLFTGDWDRMWDGIKQTLEGVWKIIVSLVEQAVATVELVISGALDAIGALWDATWTKAGEVVSGAWDTITGYVSGGIDSLVGFVTGIPGRIADAVGDMFMAIPDGFKAAINSVIDMWNRMQIPGISIHQGMPGPIPDINIDVGPWDLPDIPRLHTGGIFDSGMGEGLALLRDGEGVFTPDQMDALGGPMRGGGDRHYSITVVNEPGSDPAEGGRRVVEAIAAFEQRNGASWRAGERAA